MVSYAFYNPHDLQTYIIFVVPILLQQIFPKMINISIFGVYVCLTRVGGGGGGDATYV